MKQRARRVKSNDNVTRVPLVPSIDVRVMPPPSRSERRPPADRGQPLAGQGYSPPGHRFPGATGEDCKASRCCRRSGEIPPVAQRRSKGVCARSRDPGRPVPLSRHSLGDAGPAGRGCSTTPRPVQGQSLGHRIEPFVSQERAYQRAFLLLDDAVVNRAGCGKGVPRGWLHRRNAGGGHGLPLSGWISITANGRRRKIRGTWLDRNVPGGLPVHSSRSRCRPPAG